MRTILKKIIKNNKGQSNIEMAMLIGLMSLMVIGIFVGFSPELKAMFQSSVDDETVGKGMASTSEAIYGMYEFVLNANIIVAPPSATWWQAPFWDLYAPVDVIVYVTDKDDNPVENAEVALTPILSGVYSVSSNYGSFTGISGNAFHFTTDSSGRAGFENLWYKNIMANPGANLTFNADVDYEEGSLNGHAHASKTIPISVWP